MMNKNGFTLIELMVVIAIIAILSVIIVPSVITVNKNVNERLYQQKEENIISAAELYASNNPDIFNGSNRVYVYVYQLIDANYLEIDAKYGDGACTEGENISKGCVIDPRTSSENVILNNKKVLLTKKSVGIVGQMDGNDDNPIEDSNTLVDAVCERFERGDFLGLYGTNPTDECLCADTDGDTILDVLYKKGTDPISNQVDACLIVSNNDSGNVNNWLKYGSSEANWRVLGIYNIDGTLYPKMITADVID